MLKNNQTFFSVMNGVLTCVELLLWGCSFEFGMKLNAVQLGCNLITVRLMNCEFFWHLSDICTGVCLLLLYTRLWFDRSFTPVTIICPVNVFVYMINNLSLSILNIVLKSMCVKFLLVWFKLLRALIKPSFDCLLILVFCITSNDEFYKNEHNSGECLHSVPCKVLHSWTNLYSVMSVLGESSDCARYISATGEKIVLACLYFFKPITVVLRSTKSRMQQ